MSIQAAEDYAGSAPAAKDYTDSAPAAKDYIDSALVVEDCAGSATAASPGPLSQTQHERLCENKKRS
jgi:hypothetical protein